MSDSTASDERPDPPAPSPLGQALGLNEQELSTLGSIFAEVTRSMGIEGAPIFGRLKQGQSLGQALGMPAGAGELLYARAHRWFSIGRTDKAEPLFRALCILEQGTADYWVGYGVCLRLRGSSREAALAFEAAGKMRPEWAVPHFHSLELAVQDGDWTAAARHLVDYDQRVTPDIADAIKTEVERLRTAVSTRQGHDASKR